MMGFMQKHSIKLPASLQPNSVKGVATGESPVAARRAVGHYIGCPDRMSTQQGTRRQDPTNDRDEVVAALPR